MVGTRIKKLRTSVFLYGRYGLPREAWGGIRTDTKLKFFQQRWVSNIRLVALRAITRDSRDFFTPILFSDVVFKHVNLGILHWALIQEDRIPLTFLGPSLTLKHKDSIVLYGSYNWGFNGRSSFFLLRLGVNLNNFFKSPGD